MIGMRLARRSLHRRPAMTVAAAVLAVGTIAAVAGVVTVAASGGDPRGLHLLGAAATVVASGVATLSGVVVLRAGRGPRAFVRTMTLALGMYCIGSATWLVELARYGPTTPGLHDTALVAAAAVAMVAVLRHPELGPRHRRVRSLVDVSIFALSTAVLLWLLAGRAMWTATDDLVATVAAVLAVACMFGATRAAITVTLTRMANSPDEAAATLVTTGLLSVSAGGVLHLLHHAQRTGELLAALGDLLLVAGFSMINVAPLMMLGASRPMPLDRLRARLGTLQELTPIAISAGATLAVLVDAAARGRFDATASAVLTVVICAVLLRQSLTLSDNRQLSASLRLTVDGLEQQATHDPLTGLPNRNGLHDRIADAAARAVTTGSVCAVYFVDLDHLKSINDSLGHSAGDLLIRTTAERLTRRVGARVTRFGGDEFVMVVGDLTDAADAELLGRNIVDDLALPVALEGHQVRSSASVGIALVEQDTAPEELLRRADVALYRAKSLGRRYVAAYDPAVDAGKQLTLDLEPELRRGIARGEFVLHYQPIIDLDTGDLVSVESLLRWEHPERGLLGPGAFLDAAVSTGVLGTIGASSLRTACVDFATMCRRSTDPDVGPPPPSVAVNLSSSELADRRVVDRVAAALSESGLAPARLTLEITEDVIIDEAVRATIDRLCDLGIHLAIDDFGTGNSSLRQLGAYPADVLKIDKSFVDHLETDERAAAITRTVVRLAGNLGLITLAEGVETEAQAELLSRMGCERAQGWLFAKAMPFDELVDWWTERTARGYRGYGDRRASVASASSMMRSSSSATGGRSSIAPTT